PCPHAPAPPSSPAPAPTFDQTALKIERNTASKYRLPLDWVSEEVWITSLSEKAASVEDLFATVESQVRFHKLVKVRRS
ncbi:hypothetical protein ACFYSJ_38380, partial [Streptomyces sp. NPDC005248]|uniref:hypothetical protein n=1 Tax=Streptomyces sp. NPDC005248 TaxID=3364709 RepID=UPI0036A4E86A